MWWWPSSEGVPIPPSTTIPTEVIPSPSPTPSVASSSSLSSLSSGSSSGSFSSSSVTTTSSTSVSPSPSLSPRLFESQNLSPELDFEGYFPASPTSPTSSTSPSSSPSYPPYIHPYEYPASTTSLFPTTKENLELWPWCPSTSKRVVVEGRERIRRRFQCCSYECLAEYVSWTPLKQKRERNQKRKEMETENEELDEDNQLSEGHQLQLQPQLQHQLQLQYQFQPQFPQHQNQLEHEQQQQQQQQQLGGIRFKGESVEGEREQRQLQQEWFEGARVLREPKQEQKEKEDLVKLRRSRSGGSEEDLDRMEQETEEIEEEGGREKLLFVCFHCHPPLETRPVRQTSRQKIRLAKHYLQDEKLSPAAIFQHLMIEAQVVDQTLHDGVPSEVFSVPSVKQLNSYRYYMRKKAKAENDKKPKS